MNIFNYIITIHIRFIKLLYLLKYIVMVLFNLLIINIILTIFRYNNL